MGKFKYQRHSATFPSRRRSVLFKTLGVCFLLFTFQFLRSQLISQEALKAEFAATDFGDFQLRSIKPTGLSSWREALLAARPEWKYLGSGFEGSTFIWQDNVIKIFHLARNPLRNCVRGGEREESGLCNTDASRWPTEIPASLLLGNDGRSSNGDGTGFLPVTDFFQAESPEDAQPRWHLVTPLMSGGTLLDLGRKTVANEDLENVRDVDERFRSAFNDLLATMVSLHARNFCHDDIKPDNIFIDGNARWLMGDLGNVRETTHPYHTSRLWKRNHQVPDCRANDVLRAIKSYLKFLRSASEQGSWFNEMLFQAREPWARLFWMANEAGTALSAADLQHWSLDLAIPDSPPHYVSRYEQVPKGLWNPVLRLWHGRNGIIERAADDALGFSMSEGWARAMAMTAFFGIPAEPCP